MAQEFQYFYEDEVYRFNHKGNLELGMVLENAEFVSSDEDSDNDEEDKVTKGSIRVAWYPKGEEEVLPERKVGLGDRSLMPGDVVRRLIKGKDTQRGYCRQVHVSASVQVVGTKFVILNVDSSQLTPLEDFTADIAVALDSWVGMVNMVKCRIVMVTSDGSKCILSDHEALDLDDLRDSRDTVRMESEFRRYDFYPGQQLVGPGKIFEDAEWIVKSSKDSSQYKNQRIMKATVEEVQVVQLGVRWQCRAFSSDHNADKDQPKYLVQGEDLKRVRMLNVFEPCTLQLGDRNYYVLREGDVVMGRDQWRKLMATNLMEDKMNPCPLRPRTLKNKKKISTNISNNVCNETVQEGLKDCSENDVSKASLGDQTSDKDEFVDVDTDELSDTASIGSSASTGSQGRRNKKGPALMTKVLKKRKLKRAKRKTEKSDLPSVKPGDRLVVETLMTGSRADVVWQDGSVEDNIPSTVLYPIHHLDDQEFFPGDFVVEQKDSLNTHEYGVVQKVDHAGRTAKVKWFHTYTAGEEPRPVYKCEQEVSVYDLRDHPDFRYRPGSVVIRVANFENGQTCSTGQVLDNFPTGEVSVWWVDSSTSVCYPQDLYKVGEYDSDEGELWDDTASDESWETESEHSVIAEESENENDNQLKTKLVANIEKARIAMSRLEEIFTQNPSLQTTAVMKQLLDCYKECRCMDKLMGTCFFHEGNFQGLIEKVRERGRASTTQRMAEQFNRLFSANFENENLSPTNNGKQLSNKVNGIDTEEALTIKKHSNKKLEKNENTQNNTKCTFNKNDILKTSNNLCENLANLSASSGKLKHDKQKSCETLKHKRLSETDMLNDDKRSEMKDSKSCSDLKLGNSGASCSLFKNATDDFKTSHMCAQLCSLMKAQLLKTYEEVVCRFGGHFDMSLMQSCQDGDVNVGEFKENILNSKTYDLVNENCVMDENSSTSLCQTNSQEISVKRDSSEATNHFEKNLMDGVLSPLSIQSPTAGVINSEIPTIQPDGFQVLEAAPDCHKFKLTMFQPNDPSHFYRTVRKEMKLLKTSLPPGIWVRGYEDRMDLYSVMIRGPEKTPYEDGLFFFDFQLSSDYPRAPPLCHYVTYCSDKLNPNLYEDGKLDHSRVCLTCEISLWKLDTHSRCPRHRACIFKSTLSWRKADCRYCDRMLVCVSLLGTWSGKGTEVWTSQSNLLQVIISIQGLILVNEPYFNEAGYERQKGTQQGRENSRMYNEMVLLKLIQAMSKVIQNPPQIFKEEIYKHFNVRAHSVVSRLEKWLCVSENYNTTHPLSPTTPTTFKQFSIKEDDHIDLPEYPLIPASKGFCITLHKTLENFRQVLQFVGVGQNSPLSRSDAT